MRVIINHDETPVPKRLEFFTVDIEHTGILDKTIAVQLFFAFKIVLVDPDFPVADAKRECGFRLRKIGDKTRHSGNFDSVPRKVLNKFGKRFFIVAGRETCGKRRQGQCGKRTQNKVQIFSHFSSKQISSHQFESNIASLRKKIKGKISRNAFFAKKSGRTACRGGSPRKKSYREPLVEGTPFTRGSIVTAVQRARPNALNIASNV